MKKSIVTLLLASACTAGFAQVSYNIKAGMNLSNYMGSDADGSQFKPGFRVGLGMEYQFSDMFSIQPSFVFSQKGAKASGTINSSSDYFKAELSVNQLYLEIPVNTQLRFEIGNNLNLIMATGPYFGYGVGGKTTIKAAASLGNYTGEDEEKIDTFSENGLGLKRFDIGWGLGLGFEFERFIFMVDSQFGFKDIEAYSMLRNMNLGVTMGYKF
ncbi:MAG: porin family protein [Bacteroidales bacterium]